jgi:hypothetical protein
MMINPGSNGWLLAATAMATFFILFVVALFPM